MMTELFTTGRAVDLVLAFVLIEAGLLYILHRRSGRGLAPRALLRLLIPGVCLLFALRAALTGAAWSIVAVWLLLSLAAHLVDLKQRWSD